MWNLDPSENAFKFKMLRRKDYQSAFDNRIPELGLHITKLMHFLLFLFKKYNRLCSGNGKGIPPLNGILKKQKPLQKCMKSFTLPKLTSVCPRTEDNHEAESQSSHKTESQNSHMKESQSSHMTESHCCPMTEPCECLMKENNK